MRLTLGLSNGDIVRGETEGLCPSDWAVELTNWQRVDGWGVRIGSLGGDSVLTVPIQHVVWYA